MKHTRVESICAALRDRGENLVNQTTKWLIFTRKYTGLRGEGGELRPTDGSHNPYWMVSTITGQMRLASGRLVKDKGNPVKSSVIEALILEGRHVLNRRDEALKVKC